MPGRREIYDRPFGLSTIILMFAKFVDEPPSPCRLEKASSRFINQDNGKFSMSNVDGLSSYFPFAIPRTKSEWRATFWHAASAGIFPVSNATVTQAEAGASSELAELVSW